MTESDWFSCTDAEAMLSALRDASVFHVKFSERKCRLFAVACCRLNVHLAQDPVCVELLALAEDMADGIRVNPGKLLSKRVVRGNGAIEESCAWTCNPIMSIFESVKFVMVQARRRGAQYKTDGMHFANVLRHLVGNPYAPVTVNPAWMTWNDDTAYRLAMTAYLERMSGAHGLLDPVRLAILADALEEAGCTDRDILKYLRDHPGHWRGCHVLDALLGKR